ncbi:MAG: SPOR domain-containing protein [Sphingomonas sp.]
MRTGFRAMLVGGGIALAASAAWAQANPVKAGVDAWGRQDYAAAIKEWQGPAARGDADAQFNMGQAYKLGHGVPQDRAKALDWYRKAAEQGHFQAQDNYGLLLFQDGQLKQSVPWLEKSVARGNAPAELVLGTMLFNGDGGLNKDWPRAYALMTRASDAGLADASKTLGEMDKYIPEDQRRQGLTLAQHYAAEARRPHLPPELTGHPATPIRTTPVPPSEVAAAAPGASYAPPGAAASPSAAAPVKPMRHVEPVPAKAVATPKPQPAPAASDGKWRVQLGAFSTEDRARRLWQELNPKVAALHDSQLFLVHAGAVTRLQAGGFASSAAADRVCAAVKRAGNACLPVAP